jgi:hypothetical protein
MRHKRHYSENNLFFGDTAVTLFQSISYNKPAVIDEEFSYILQFKIIDTTAAKRKRLLNLVADTAIVTTKYDVISVWNWEDEKYSLTGSIEIIDWGDKRIRIKQDILVNDARRKKTLSFNGQRTFTKKKAAEGQSQL